jgi:hypothetical protein
MWVILVLWAIVFTLSNIGTYITVIRMSLDVGAIYYTIKIIASISVNTVLSLIICFIWAFVIRNTIKYAGTLFEYFVVVAKNIELDTDERVESDKEGVYVVKEKKIEPIAPYRLEADVKLLNADSFLEEEEKALGLMKQERDQIRKIVYEKSNVKDENEKKGDEFVHLEAEHDIIKDNIGVKKVKLWRKNVDRNDEAYKLKASTVEIDSTDLLESEDNLLKDMQQGLNVRKGVLKARTNTIIEKGEEALVEEHVVTKEFVEIEAEGNVLDGNVTMSQQVTEKYDLKEQFTLKSEVKEGDYDLEIDDIDVDGLRASLKGRKKELEEKTGVLLKDDISLVEESNTSIEIEDKGEDLVSTSVKYSEPSGTVDLDKQRIDIEISEFDASVLDNDRLEELKETWKSRKSGLDDKIDAIVDEHIENDELNVEQENNVYIYKS